MDNWYIQNQDLLDEIIKVIEESLDLSKKEWFRFPQNFKKCSTN